MSGRSRVGHLPGRVNATDKELLDAYKTGMFLQQIRKKYKVGIKRLRGITRAYDATQVSA